jgi:F0F1-type ATP synthase membrane subunit b/b'
MDFLTQGIVTLAEPSSPNITIDLAPNMVEVLMQLIVTFAAVYLIKRKFWNRIKEYFQKQNDLIGENISNAVSQKKEADELFAQNQKVAKEVNEKYNEAIARAEKDAQVVRQDILQKAQQEADQYKATQFSAVESHKNQALSEIEQYTVKIADEMVGKILNSSNQSASNKLIDEAIEVI